MLSLVGNHFCEWSLLHYRDTANGKTAGTSAFFPFLHYCYVNNNIYYRRFFVDGNNKAGFLVSFALKTICIISAHSTDQVEKHGGRDFVQADTALLKLNCFDMQCMSYIAVRC